MVLADTGEDTLVICSRCDYAANMEKAQVKALDDDSGGRQMLPLKKVETPGKRKVAAVTGFLNITSRQLVKTMVYLADGKPVAVLVRGDHEVQPVKLANHLGVVEVEMADDKQVFDATGVPTGYLGPAGLKIPVVADVQVARMANFAIGANDKNYHYINANLERDFEVSAVVDLRQATADDHCVKCGAGLELTKGIEVGHIFKLGDSYSRAMNATYQDSNGEEKHFVMGCYGIGVSRTVAASIEQNHDDNGIVFPLPIAPMQVIVLNLGPNDEAISVAAEGFYGELKRRGVEVLIDDRDERPGVKFKDADLIGIPVRVTVGKSYASEGAVEIRQRRGGETATLPIDEGLERVVAIVTEELQRVRQSE